MATLLLLSISSCTCSHKEKPGEQIPFDGSTYPSEINPDKTAPAGNIFYCDPVNGSMDNDGSKDRPRTRLQDVVENNLIETRESAVHPCEEEAGLIIKNEGAPVKAGDTIMLRSWYHGAFPLTGAYNTEYINIMAYNDYSSVFADWENFDLHLNSTSAGIADAETSELAPIIDIERNIRPKGSGLDIGIKTLLL